MPLESMEISGSVPYGRKLASLGAPMTDCQQSQMMKNSMVTRLALMFSYRGFSRGTKSSTGMLVMLCGLLRARSKRTYQFLVLYVVSTVPAARYMIGQE